MSALTNIVNRIPPRHHLFLAFLVCSFPIQAWSWFVFLYKLPSYLLSLTIWQTVGVFAYIQAFVLLESGFLWLILTLLATALPNNLYRRQFVAQTLIIVLALTIWAVGVHFQFLAAATETNEGQIFGISAWSLVCLVGMILGVILAVWKPRIAGFLVEVVERLTVIAGLYLFIAGLAVIALVVRSITILLRGSSG